MENQMSWMTKSIRVAVAGVLAFSVLAVSASAQAQEPSGSLAADGNGGVTATFAEVEYPEGTGIAVVIFEAPATCPTATDDLLAAPYGFSLTESQSPVTLTVGTLVVSDLSGNIADTPLPAGTYQFCMMYLNFFVGSSVLASLEAVIGVQPTTTAPTTTTTAPTTTTTAAPAAPATPRFTG
jgi:hypothetical protein